MDYTQVDEIVQKVLGKPFCNTKPSEIDNRLNDLLQYAFDAGVDSAIADANERARARSEAMLSGNNREEI